MKHDEIVDGEAMSAVEGVDVTHLLGKLDDELKDALATFIEACRALPPKGEFVPVGLVSAVVVARARFYRALNHLTDATGVDRV